jgi:hypothetical protein
LHDFELSHRDERDLKRALDPTARAGNWIAHPTSWKISDHRGGFIWIYLPLYIFAGRAFYDAGDVFWNEQEFRWRSTALEDCLNFTISSGTFNFSDQAWPDHFSQAGTIWLWSDSGHNHVCESCLAPIIGIICLLESKWNDLVAGTKLAFVTLVNALKMRPKNQLLFTSKKFHPS